MHKVHFIALGNATLHNFAIALSQKNGYAITGSDEDFSDEISLSLNKAGLFPDYKGWKPARLTKGMIVVIPDEGDYTQNPEYLKALELGLKVQKLPEYIYQQTRNKTRIVIYGEKNNSLTSAIILFVLNRLKMDIDYMIIRDNQRIFHLTYESRIAILECPENQQTTNQNMECSLLKPHIAVLTGIHNSNDNRIAQIKHFIEQIEVQGRLIYNETDEVLENMAVGLRRDLVSFAYNVPKYKTDENICYLETSKKSIPVQLSSEEELKSLEAARLTCRQIGVNDIQFYQTISDFKLDA